MQYKNGDIFVYAWLLHRTREFEIVENILLVFLLDLTADFGVKTNAQS